MTYTGARGGRVESPRPTYGLGFRIDNQIKFYSHTLYWLVHHIGLVEVATEFLDDGELVVYGKMSCDQLDDLVATGRLGHIRHHYWGISWPYGRQAEGAEDDFVDYEHWRDRLLTAAHGVSSDWSGYLPLFH